MNKSNTKARGCYNIDGQLAQGSIKPEAIGNMLKISPTIALPSSTPQKVYPLINLYYIIMYYSHIILYFIIMYYSHIILYALLFQVLTSWETWTRYILL